MLILGRSVHRQLVPAEALLGALSSAERRKSALMAERLGNPDVYTAEEFKSQKAILDGEILRLRSDVRKAEQKLEHDRRTVENILDFAVNAPRCFAEGDMKTRKQIAMQLGSKYVLTLGKLEIVPRPLLVPILAFEPLKNGSDNRKDDHHNDDRPSWLTIRDAILTVLWDGDHSFPRLAELHSTWCVRFSNRLPRTTNRTSISPVKR